MKSGDRGLAADRRKQCGELSHSDIVKTLTTLRWFHDVITPLITGFYVRQTLVLGRVKRSVRGTSTSPVGCVAQW